MTISHFLKYLALTFFLPFLFSSVEAMLTEPIKEAPKGFQRVSSPKKVKYDETGFYYENEDDKAQSVDKEFYKRNKNCLRTSTAVKFTPRDESDEDKGQDSHKRKKSLHQRNKSHSVSKTHVKYTSRVESDDEEEDKDVDTEPEKRELRQSKRLKLDEKDTSSDAEAAEKVLGATDGRKQIKTPWQFPHSIHGHMRIKISSRTYMGSGTMIDETHVLTAGHNLFFRQFKSAPDKITFFPGLHGQKARWTAKGASWVTHPRYVDSKASKKEVRNHDIGIVTLNKLIGQETGFMGLDKMEKKKLEKAQLTIKGYPGDLGNGSFMYSMTGPVMSVEKEQISYKIDTAGGQSGSGVFDEETGTIRGVHTYGGTEATGNKGTRITEKFRKLIEDWKTI